VIKFICGCMHDFPSDSVVLDSDGFMVCLAHHERRSGWRSLPTQGGRPDYSFSSWTALQVERFMYFGEFPPRTEIAVRNISEDRRDNRDPVILGNEILAKANGV